MGQGADLYLEDTSGMCVTDARGTDGRKIGIQFGDGFVYWFLVKKDGLAHVHPEPRTTEWSKGKEPKSREGKKARAAALAHLRN